jgi:hypothetical protein
VPNSDTPPGRAGLLSMLMRVRSSAS